MATIIADNIISPLGFSTQASYQAVKAGKTALRQYQNAPGIPFAFSASLFSKEQKEDFLLEGYTPFESLAITSIKKALETCPLHLDERTCLVISSTKLNVNLLTDKDVQENVHYPGRAAEKIAHAVGITTTPIIVCNACISGVSALILANRLIEQKEYDYVIVCGVDVQSPFIISGFQSLKALSENSCQPFDIERTGLNLGEAAATIILSKEECKNSWHITGSAVRNDAFHISSPSPKGEGCRMVIETALSDGSTQELALINAHGTATLYNDQMEARAIVQAGLTDVPVNALKGYFGHTMGAAGILETIITMHSLDNGIIIGTKGYKEMGVSGNINIIPDNTATGKTSFLKIISGFGGCNAAIHLSKESPSPAPSIVRKGESSHTILITPQKATIDNEEIETEGQTGRALLTHLYKTKIKDYPKYYKMDSLARLGFVATELLLQKEKEVEGDNDRQNRAIIFFNASSSINADKTFRESIKDPENFFPSPSAFVYTLPNIVNGEIAIRNGYHGETAFYILPQKDDNIMRMITQATLHDDYHKSIISGWLECKNEDDFYAELKIKVPSL